MSRIVHPVELGAPERRLVQRVKAHGERVLARRVTVSEIIRRSIVIAAPRILRGDEPLCPEVSLKR